MNNFIIKTLSFFYNVTLLPIVRKIYTYKSLQIPKFEVSSKHIERAKLLTTRDELLKILPKSGVVAELGVDCGDFSESILNINNPRKLHLIDAWHSKSYSQKKRKYVENRFSDKVQENKVEINIGLSTEVVNLFEDHYFDWIYIDTAHTYKTTISELESYRKKVKRNGIIAGHDYRLGTWHGMVRYGVIEAVHEFCTKHDWEIIFLTSELKTHPSFALRKITGDNN